MLEEVKTTELFVAAAEIPSITRACLRMYSGAIIADTPDSNGLWNVTVTGNRALTVFELNKFGLKIVDPKGGNMSGAICPDCDGCKTIVVPFKVNKHSDATIDVEVDCDECEGSGLRQVAE